jgi:hypothetical protein
MEKQRIVRFRNVRPEMNSRFARRGRLKKSHSMGEAPRCWRNRSASARETVLEVPRQEANSGAVPQGNASTSVQWPRRGGFSLFGKVSCFVSWRLFQSGV